ncbi:MAG: hypothetical protein WAZ14_00295 [Patescibacteria group bacterium]
MSSPAELINIIAASPLSETTKDFFTKKVEAHGATPEIVDALRELIRAVKGQTAQALGSGLPKTDSQLIAATKVMQSEIKAATDTYASTMQKLEEHSARLAADIQEDLKHIEKLVVDSATAEA